LRAAVMHEFGHEVVAAAGEPSDRFFGGAEFAVVGAEWWSSCVLAMWRWESWRRYGWDVGVVRVRG
jgi:hypothetical protein